MLKKTLPHFIALTIFALISVFYFLPQYEGKDVRMHDDIQATGMTGGITEHIEKYGEHPQWAPNMFSGMPAYLINMNYDGRLLKEASRVFYFLGTPAAYYFILMAGFYFMLLCFGINPYLAIVGSIGYGLSSYFFIIYEAGHITKLMALSFIAPLIGSIYYTYTKNLWLGASFAAAFAAIEISTSHPQIPYYFFFVIVAIFAAQLYNYKQENKIKEFIKRSCVLIVAAMLGLGANIVQLWYINDYSKDSTRSKSELTLADSDTQNQTSGLDKDYITAWSYGKMETFNLYIPNLYGGSSMGGFSSDGEVSKSLKKYTNQASKIATSLPGYWGPQPSTSGPVYVGAVMIFLFIFGLFILKGKEKYWLIAVTALSLLLAWGHHLMWFTDLFIDYFPGYNKFRTVSMILVIAEWSIPLLGMLALKKLWDNEIPQEKLLSALKTSSIISAAICIFFALVWGNFVSFEASYDGSMGLPEDVVMAMSDERLSIMRSDAFRSLIFSLLTAGTIFLFYKGKLKKNYFVIVLGLLILADMIPVNKRFLNGDDFITVKEAKTIKPTSADLEILKDKDLSYRVVNLSTNPFADATTSYFHKSIGGYHAAKMRRYQEIIDKYLMTMDMDVYNMLNARYFINSGENGALTVSYNNDALGNGWFVENVDLVKSVNDEYNMLEDINPKTTAIVNEKFANLFEGFPLTNNTDTLSSVTLTDYKANKLTYKTNSSQKGFVVFSEIYYPKGWSATIDGTPVEIINANYILRGLVVPAGEHTIEFSFKAPGFNTMVMITYISSILIILMLFFSIYLTYKQNGKVQS
ncbi:MAG: YfhO family protein [Rikenellaceae bacterium]